MAGKLSPRWQNMAHNQQLMWEDMASNRNMSKLSSNTSSMATRPQCGITDNSLDCSSKEKKRRRRSWKKRKMKGEMVQFLFTQIIERCKLVVSPNQDFWTVNVLTSRCEQLPLYFFAFNNPNFQLPLSFPRNDPCDLVIYIRREEISRCNLAQANFSSDLSHGFCQIIQALPEKGRTEFYIYGKNLHLQSSRQQ